MPMTSSAEQRKSESKLVVLLHGLRSSPDALREVKELVRETYSGCEIFAPELPYAGWNWLSSKHPSRVVAELVATLDKRWNARKERPLDSIVLVGHSLGGLLARKLAIVAHGEVNAEVAPFEPELEVELRKPRAWASAIERIVLLAGVTKGTVANTAHDWITQQVLRASFAVAEIFAPDGIVTQTRLGYPFIVQTRLQWMALFSHARYLCKKRERTALQVVQLIGTRDKLVAPDDTIDLVDLTGSPWAFSVLEMGNTDHAGALRVREPQRGQLFRDALQKSADDLAEHEANVVVTTGANAARTSKPELYVSGVLPDPSVTDVTFVVHGIRDSGHWTRKVARKIEREAASAGGRKFRSMTASYGYLAMFPFVWPGVRKNRAAWLMDRYVEMRALYPNAVFHYVGHSNGTYLAARALTDYAAARFERVVFAGSVVRRDYDWKSKLPGTQNQNGRARVGALLNYVAASDWVVAIFANGLQIHRFFDLGGAGHTGFKLFDYAQVEGTVKTANHNSYQIEYISGGHGAGIKESQWDDIARFVVSGQKPSAKDDDYADQRSPWMRTLGSWPPTALVAILVVFTWFLWFSRDWLSIDIAAWTPQHIGLVSFASVIVAWIILWLY